MTTIEQLYKDFGVLAEAKEKAGEFDAEFLSILSALSGNENEKRLALQFIVRFSKYFPQHLERVIEGHFDMCEDENVMIRKQAIKNLAVIAKDKPSVLQKISDILIQLMATEDQVELNCIHNALIDLIKLHPKVMLEAVFGTILFCSTNPDEKTITTEDESDRHSAITFISSKISTLSDALTTELEQVILEKCKKVLQDVTGEEFVMIMKMLGQLKSLNTLQGRSQLIELIVEQAALDEQFEPSAEDVDRITQCARQALPYMSKNVHSTEFVEYILENILPVFSDIPGQEAHEEDGANGNGAAETSATTSSDKVNVNQLEILKTLAELAAFCGAMQQPLDKLDSLYTCMQNYLPKSSDVEGEKEAAIDFTFVECFLYTFHKLAARHPEVLTADDKKERLQDFRLRLRFLDSNIKAYIKELRSALMNVKGEALKTEENKLKVVALKTTNNINMLIKDLFHNPPSYKAHISLSWKPLQKPGEVKPTDVKSSPVAGEKRSAITPVTFESDISSKYERKMYSDRQLYQPPTGKFSNSAGAYTEGGYRGRGRYRGGYGTGYRGRGRGFRGRRW